jgi:hypothetical protein
VHGILFLDANLIRVAPKCDDTSRHACLYRGTLGHNAYSQNNKGMRMEKGKAEVWNFLSDLCPSVLNHAELMVCLVLFSGVVVHPPCHPAAPVVMPLLICENWSPLVVNEASHDRMTRKVRCLTPHALYTFLSIL